MLESVKKEAIAAIIEATGSEPVLVDHAMECILRLAYDMDISAEKFSDELFVARDLEEDGQKFDYWMYCKYGPKHTGQTITAVIIK